MKRSLVAHNPFLTPGAETVLASPRAWGGKAEVGREAKAGSKMPWPSGSVHADPRELLLPSKQSQWGFKSPVQTDDQEKGVIFQPYHYLLIVCSLSLTPKTESRLVHLFSDCLVYDIVKIN